MKTPYAILIGLALIVAAIFYREPSISAAQAGGIETKYMDDFKCVPSVEGSTTCAILHGNQITYSFWHPDQNDIYLTKTFKGQ